MARDLETMKRGKRGMEADMAKGPIAVDEFIVRAHQIWSSQWFLLTSGDFAIGCYNTMTVAWGAFGVMWGMPFAQVVVRPTRYTYEFMEKFDTFTLCAFPERLRDTLLMLGSKSGRNCRKIAESGLTPVRSAAVAAPGFAEAELIIECRQIYFDDFEPARFIDPEIEKNYEAHDYHRIHYGKVLAISGDSKYRGDGE